MRFVPALDGLRGIAVALVFLRHAAYLGTFRDDIPTPVAAFLLNGWVGVDLFFVLSGFLIARPFFAGQPFWWPGYLARRAFRILPAYVLVLALVVTLPWLLVDRRDLGWRLAYHALFLQDYLPSNLLVVLWSLGVEEKLYLLMPLLVPALLRASGPRRQCLILVAAVLLGPLCRGLALAVDGPPEDYVAFFRVYRSPFHACLDSIVLGVLVARLETLRLSWMTPPRARRLFMVAAAWLVAWMAREEFLADLGAGAIVLRPLALGLGMAGLVLAAVHAGSPRIVEGAVLRWLGRISYSLYLVHVPVLLPCIAVARASGSGFGTFLLVYAATSLAAATAMQAWIEAPFNAWGRRLRARWDGQRTAVQPPALLEGATSR